MSTYKVFPQANLIREWDKLIKLSKEEVEDLYESWKMIHVENEEIRKRIWDEKNEKLESISAFMKSVGVDVFKYKKSGFIPQKNGYQAWYQKNIVDVISKNYPQYSNSIPTAHMEKRTIDGVEIYNNQSPTNIVELYNRVKFQYDSKIKEVNKMDKLLIKSIEFANKHNINIEDLSPKEVIDVINENAKELYSKENYPDGEEVYLNHECYECDTYIVGERRCSCGNVRVDIEVEGDLISGFIGYPVTY